MHACIYILTVMALLIFDCLKGHPLPLLTPTIDVQALHRGTSLFCELLTSEKKRCANVFARAELPLFNSEGCLRTGQLCQRLMPCLASEPKKKIVQRALLGNLDFDFGLGVAEVTMFMNPDLVMYMHTLHTPEEAPEESSPSESSTRDLHSASFVDDLYEMCSPRRSSTHVLICLEKT